MAERTGKRPEESGDERRERGRERERVAGAGVKRGRRWARRQRGRQAWLAPVAAPERAVAGASCAFGVCCVLEVSV